MPHPAQAEDQSPLVRFGLFEVDLHTREIRKSGRKVNLQGQPFQVLAALLERPGELVTREELQEKLWPAETVDFESGLNKAIKKIREALGDSAGNPRFVETLSRRGYRFIAAAERVGIHYAITPAMRAATKDLASEDTPQVESIAVLPLENLSGDQAQDYFADGMTDGLITEVARIASLRVISRTSIMQYKGARKPLALIASELGVDAIVEGTVLHAGQRVRITAQLVRVRDDRHLWAEKYERDLNDVLALQADVAQAIAAQIQSRLTPENNTRSVNPRRVNIQAYEFWLEASYFRNKVSEASLSKSLELFQKAIDLDPTYAPSYAGLAESYCMLGIIGSRLPFDVYPKAKAAAIKALELDDTCEQAHNSLADIKKGFDWDWVTAEAGYRRALALNPSYSLAHMWYADYLSKMGRHAEAVAEARHARELDPVSVDRNSFLGLVLYRARRYDEAVAACQKAVELDPDYPVARWFLALAHEQRCELPAATAELEKAVILSRRAPLYQALLGHAYALGDERTKAFSILDELMALSAERYVSPLDIAIVYTGLGERDSVFQWLEKAYQERTMRIQELPQPIFDSLRSDPRFHDLMRRINLPL